MDFSNVIRTQTFLSGLGICTSSYIPYYMCVHLSIYISHAHQFFVTTHLHQESQDLEAEESSEASSTSESKVEFIEPSEVKSESNPWN